MLVYIVAVVTPAESVDPVRPRGSLVKIQLTAVGVVAEWGSGEVWPSVGRVGLEGSVH